jgi:protocatechuate 3,4-dioxygenase beta subunit
MYERADYGDVVAEVRAELSERVQAAEAAGVGRHQLLVDPGLGFAKRPAQTMALLAGLSELSVIGCPLVSGPSRKSFLQSALGERDPEMKLGDCIVSSPRQQVVIYGQVTDATGKPIPNASVEIWQTDEDGAYDLQKQVGVEVPTMDMRGHFHTDAEGKYYLRTVIPLGYMIPMDGPVGGMITAQKRHGYRPSHIHFMIGAPGYRELATALYTDGDDHLESDTVFGVTASLVIKPVNNDPNAPIKGMPAIHYDFQLALAAKLGSGRVGADPSQITKAGA